MIYTSEVIHDNVVDLGKQDGTSLEQLTPEEVRGLSDGNKLAVLMGDYLLANASAGLGKLYNVEVRGNSIFFTMRACISRSMFVKLLAVRLSCIAVAVFVVVVCSLCTYLEVVTTRIFLVNEDWYLLVICWMFDVV